LRVVSAAVLGPPALAAVWYGGAWLAGLVLIAVALMGWEWARLVGRGGFGPAGIAVVATGLAAVAAAADGGLSVGGLVAAGGAVVVFGAALAGGAEPLWAAGGTLWLAVGTAAFMVLAALPEAGRDTALWLLAVVWANDTAAYVCGRTIGGPKLAPRFSPNKTWAGFAGGVASAGLAGWIAGWLAESGSPLLLIGLSLLLGVAAQLGDLAESAAKRHFGVKDASALIPGHGGLLDRVDGLLAASILAGLLALATGRSPLLW